MSIKTLLAITERPAKKAIVNMELVVSSYRNASGSKSNETSKWLAKILIKPIVEGVTSASGSDVESFHFRKFPESQKSWSFLSHGD